MRVTRAYTLDGLQWRATCPRCTWTHHGDELSATHDEASRHPSECGRMFGWLTPADFTRAGDGGGYPIPVEFHSWPEVMS